MKPQTAHIDDLLDDDCSNYSALAMELLLSCTKIAIFSRLIIH